MDGVIPRKPLDLRLVSSMNSPLQSSHSMPQLTQAIARSGAIDGVRRVAPAMNATPQTTEVFGSSEEDVRQKWIESIVAHRYRWAGGVAAGLLLPALIMAARPLTDRGQAASQSTTASPVVSAANSAPPIAAVQATPAIETDPVLQQLLQDFTAAYSTPFGLVIKDLKSGVVSTSNPDQIFTSASLYKLFVAQAVYKQIDIGKISLSSPVRGTGRNVSDCLRIMINVSDNGCGQALGALIGWGKADADLKHLGFKNTTLASPQRTTAADVALLLERLYSGTLLSPSSTDQFIAHMKDQRVNNRLPVGLPAGTSIAHKTGDLYGFVHDAGIVYGPKTDYLIVVNSGPWNNTSGAPVAFAELSSKVYAHLNQ